MKRTTGPSRDSGVTTYFYYDGCNLVQEGPANLGPTTVYAHGARADEIIARSHQQGQIVFHHYDAQGNCILLSDWVTGNIIEQYDYEAFGKPYFDDASGAGTPMSPWNNRFLFTGREWSELGSREMDGQAERPSERARTSQWLSSLKIYDYRNRMYQPELGRFMQPDPKHFTAGDYNLYRYCHNDPVNNSDPTGLYEEDVHQHLTEFLARYAGFTAQSAHNIAAANQGTDTNRQTEPYSGIAARRDFHFTTGERRNVLHDEAFATRSEERFGRYLHALQDSYSHQRGQIDRMASLTERDLVTCLLVTGRTKLQTGQS